MTIVLTRQIPSMQDSFCCCLLHLYGAYSPTTSRWVETRYWKPEYWPLAAELQYAASQDCAATPLVRYAPHALKYPAHRLSGTAGYIDV